MRCYGVLRGGAGGMQHCSTVVWQCGSGQHYSVAVGSITVGSGQWAVRGAIGWRVW